MRRLAGVVLVLALVGLPGVQRHARLRGIGEAAAARGATPAVTLAGLLALWGLHGGEARALQALPGRCGPHSREALAPDGMHCICSDTSVCFGSRCKTGHKKADPNFVVHGYPREQCPDCRCAVFSEEDQTLLALHSWTNRDLIYHVHISKTGGTTFEHILKDAAVAHGLAWCTVAKLPFPLGQYFADPYELRDSGCNVVSAEGRLRVVDEQFLGRDPKIVVFLRHPHARTLSQWNHDFRFRSQRREIVHDFSDFKSIGDMYRAAAPARVNGRYANWYNERLRLTDSDVASVFREYDSYAFIGITEHFQTSLCLFFFTFQLHSNFLSCQKRSPAFFNAACHNASDCGGRHFADKSHVSSAAAERQLMAPLLSAPIEDVLLVAEHTGYDMELYSRAKRLFWRRVALMERASGMVFDDLPEKYRVELQERDAAGPGPGQAGQKLYR